ncbi:MAG: sensor histidine kinase, partial [Nocardiaceae bacterium]|nr:sensor histidine kinase [Nocardiaceae bacterium]
MRRAGGAVSAVLWTALVVVVAVAATVVAMRTRRVLTTPAERAVHDTLHTASLAARPLRRGLDEASAREAAPHLRLLTGAESLAIAGPDGALLAWNGPHEALSEQFVAAAGQAIDGGRRVLIGHGDLDRTDGEHDVRAVVAQPLLIEHTGVVGVLGVVTTSEPGPAMLGALTEVARYACSQIEL